MEYSGEPRSQPALELSERPLYRVGDDPGEREWQRVFPGILLPDGGAVVSDQGRSPEVVRIAPDGTALVLARGGQGPAEVASPYGIQALGSDTVLVQDRGNGKVLIFEGGSFTSSVPLPDQLRSTTAVGVSAPMTLLLATSGFRELVDPWLQGHLIRFDLRDRAVDTVGSFDAFAYRRRGGATNPFGSRGSAAASGERFVVGRTDIAQLVWRSRDGALEQVLRWNAERVYPTAETLEKLLDSLRVQYPRMNPGMTPEVVAQTIARQNFQLKAGEPIPVFGGVLGDGRGGAWIAEYPMGASEPRWWSVIAADGTWLGSVTLPERFQILDVRGNRVLGVLLDSLDVQSVAVFELTESSAVR